MKKKLIALVVCLAMLAIALVGGTMAYFTDKEEKTNTFTAGNVGITLDEAIVEEDVVGNLVAKGTERTTEATKIQNYHIYPAQKITKDPTIAVASPSEATYVGAIVTVKGDLYGLMGVEPYDNIDITVLASGGLMKNHENATQLTDWNTLPMVHKNNGAVIYQKPDKANKTWTMYIFIERAMNPEEKVVLFDTLTIPTNYDNAEMAKLNGMQIDVKAYATQKHGFADCYTALTTAFPNDFKF